MTLSAELELPLPGLPISRPPRSRLQVESDRLGNVFGGLPREVEPRSDVVESTLAALRAGPSAVAGMSLAELKAVPVVLWTREAWQDDKDLITSFLARADEIWSGAVRRLWRHHFLHLNPRSFISRELGRWLGARRVRLSSRLASFSDRYSIFEPEQALERLVAAALGSGSLVEDIDLIGISPEKFRSSEVLVNILERIGHTLSTEDDEYLPLELIRRLAGEKLERVISKADCGSALKQRATKSLVEGVVLRQRHLEVRGAPPDAALDFVVALNGDPRFAGSRWQDVILPDVVTTVEQWLSRATLEAFFRILDGMPVDRPDMWKERRAFWMAYLPHIRGAWLVAGPSANAIARKERQFKYGLFEAEPVTQADHCGLMMQIGDMVVMEMNKTGSALFWGRGAKGAPKMYAAKYLRSGIMKMGGERLTHHGGWQRKFVQHILQEAGIFLRR